MINNLFNKSTLSGMFKKHGKKLTNQQKEIVSNWNKKLENNELIDERANYINFANEILTKLLGFVNDIDYKNDAKLEGKFADFLIFEDDNPHTIIELKGQNVDLDKRYKSINAVEQGFDYASKTSTVKWVIISNYDEFRLYNKQTQEKYISYTIKDLMDFNILEEFLFIFSKFSLLENNYIDNLYENTIFIERNLENEFYKLFNETRLMLIAELEHTNPEINRENIINYAQLILNRYIFICFAEDLGLLPNETSAETLMTPIEHKNLHKNTVWSRLNELFIFVNEGNDAKGIESYNGGLFKEDLKMLKIRDTVDNHEIFADSYQKWKFEEYSKNIEEKIGSTYKDIINPIFKNLLIISSFDFSSELDVNILGHVFENSIGDLEELKSDGSKGRRKKDGIFYTPNYITDYICKNTIIPYLSKSGDINTISELMKEYNDSITKLDEKLKNIKILDPACGSGAFLNKAADILLNIHKAVHEKKYENDTTLNPYFDDIESRRKILIENIYGVDLNKESIEITKLSLFLKVCKKGLKLPNIDKNIQCGNSLIDNSKFTDKPFVWEAKFKEVLDNGGFDIIIGNPPYGAKLSKDVQRYLNEKYIKGGSETAISFIKLSNTKLLKDNGNFGFIIPKSFTFASNYKYIRDDLVDMISEIVDCKKVWNEVKLEQVLLFFTKNTSKESFKSGTLENQKINIKGFIPKTSYETFGIYLNDVSNRELEIGLKLRKSNLFINDIAKNSRGGIFQKHISNNGDIDVLGGAEIQREGIIGIKGKINSELIKNDEKSFIKQNSILVQRLVAHITKPIDYIKITACFPEDRNYAIVDTINQLTFDKNINSEIYWSIINSKLINWYCYRFIFAKAIRTMQFDNPVTSRIPIHLKNLEEEAILFQYSTELINLYKKFNAEIELFKAWLERTYVIEKFSKKLGQYYELEFEEFLNELKKKKINIEERKIQELLLKEFNKSKSFIQPLKSEITIIDEKINQKIYKLYDLTEEEINIIGNLDK